jgi:hypothetical protein
MAWGAGVSDSYEIVMAGLLTMARTFGAESRELSGAVAASGVAVPDGGDAVIDAALKSALQAAGLATGQLAAVVAGHGSKLDGAYRQYRSAEETNARLCRQLTALIAGAADNGNRIAAAVRLPLGRRGHLGLQRLEDDCGRVAGKLADAGGALSRQVASVVGAGRWRGAAADAFTTVGH